MLVGPQQPLQAPSARWLTAEVWTQGKRVNEMANRMHVALPKPRDHAVRATHIPASVLAARAQQEAGIRAEPRKTEKQLEVGPSVHCDTEGSTQP